MSAKSSSKCRQRKVQCDRCGCTAWQTRSWMSVGLMSCSCGGRMTPTSHADQAFIGLIGPEDMSQADWNAICRENGWPIVLNQGQAAQAKYHGRAIAGVLADVASKPMCTYPGCGRWVAADAVTCAAGHTQGADHISAMYAAVGEQPENTMPF